MKDRLLSTWNQMLNSTVEQAPYILVAILVLLIFVVVASTVSSLLIRIGRRTRLDETLAVLLARLSQTGLLFFGLLIAAVIALPNFRPVDMLAGLGIASVAVGFALKEILQNFFAGILILWRKPFLIGDEVRTEGFQGTVEDINIRATRLRTYSGTLAVIPNSQIYSAPIEVITGLSQRRVELIVGIGYLDPLKKAKELISNVLEQTDGIHSPIVYVTELAPSSVNLKIHFWANPPQSNVLQLTDRALTQIKTTLDANDIDIPYPHTVLLFHNTTGSRAGDKDLSVDFRPAADQKTKRAS